MPHSGRYVRRSRPRAPPVPRFRLARRFAVWWSAAFVFPVVAALVAGVPALVIVVGLPASVPGLVRPLVAGRLAAALVGPGSELLEMAGRERLRLAVVAVSIVVLAVLLVPAVRFGSLLAVAVLAGAARVAVEFAQAFAAYQTLRIDPTIASLFSR